MITPENRFKRTQDLLDTYFDAGQFYVAKSDDWKNKDLSIENGIPLVMPKWSSIDIDNQEDWESFAELLYEVLVKWVLIKIFKVKTSRYFKTYINNL